MAHCPYELLNDLEEGLKVIRSLPKIKESKPGIFYLKGRGFLHFHINKENKRWADIADRDGWGKPVDLPIKPSRKVLSEFLREVEKRYSRVVAD